MNPRLIPGVVGGRRTERSGFGVEDGGGDWRDGDTGLEGRVEVETGLDGGDGRLSDLDAAGAVFGAGWDGWVQSRGLAGVRTEREGFGGHGGRVCRYLGEREGIEVG